MFSYRAFLLCVVNSFFTLIFYLHNNYGNVKVCLHIAQISSRGRELSIYIKITLDMEHKLSTAQKTGFKIKTK